MTLVELMVIIIIIGLLGSLASTKTRIFVVKAKMTQAQTLLRTSNSLVSSYLDDQGRTRFAATDPYFNANYDVIKRDMSTATSCIIANPLGVKIPDCRKQNYSLDLTVDGGGKWTLHARSVAGKVCPTDIADEWVAGDVFLSGNGVTTTATPCHMLDATKTDCAPYDPSNINWNRCGNVL